MPLESIIDLFLRKKTRDMSFKIERYGVVLRRLVEADIELVRQWRNDAAINQYMEYREHITAEMQQKWFRSIDNDQNLFYVIIYKGEKIGLISTFAIDWNKGAAECGIFIWAKAYWQGVVPVFAVLAMLDINFLVLGLESFFVKIHDNNFRAKVYNKALGYKLVENQAESMFKHYYLTRKNYLLKGKKLRKMATKLNGRSTKITIESSIEASFFLLEKLQKIDEETIKTLDLTIEKA